MKITFNYLIEIVVIFIIISWLFFIVFQYDHTTPNIITLHNKYNNDQNLKVMTYNIAHGRGYLSMDEKSFLGRNFNIKSKEELTSRLNKISEVVKEQNLDFLILEEVDFDTSWSFHVDEAKYIAKNAGFSNVVEGIKWSLNLPFLKIRSGNAILSKYPLVKASNIKFKSEPWYRKLIGGHSFIAAVYNINGQDVQVIATHLDSDSSKNREQEAQQIIDHVRASNLPTILAGDLNSVTPLTKEVNEKMRDKYPDRTLEMLSKEFNLDYDVMQPNELFTYSSENPHRMIDYVLANKGLKVTSYEVLNNKHSDHLALVSKVIFT
ncbi:hypothetical protein D6777_02600 [Candidatus Woesearchaeota archaeon]|nr:MAG: hypothetical protein D6777_02600 [Candidatus Woesearchaeota archaeon]